MVTPRSVARLLERERELDLLLGAWRAAAKLGWRTS